jgi:hypothetical protein
MEKYNCRRASSRAARLRRHRSGLLCHACGSSRGRRGDGDGRLHLADVHRHLRGVSIACLLPWARWRARAAARYHCGRRPELHLDDLLVGCRSGAGRPSLGGSRAPLAALLLPPPHPIPHVPTHARICSCSICASTWRYLPLHLALELRLRRVKAPTPPSRAHTAAVRRPGRPAGRLRRRRSLPAAAGVLAHLVP